MNQTAPGVPLHLFETGNVTYWGIGSHEFAWNETRLLHCSPEQDFEPSKFGVPMYCEGYLINQIEIGGESLLQLAARRGIPVELFSEVSTFPQVAWPVFRKGQPVIFEVTAPPPPPRPRPFTAAFYGSQPFTLEQLEQRRIEREKRAAEREAGLPDKATCDVHGCKSLQRFDQESSIAPPTWAQVTLVDADGETEDFTLCAEHAQKVKAVLTGVL